MELGWRHPGGGTRKGHTEGGTRNGPRRRRGSGQPAPWACATGFDEFGFGWTPWARPSGRPRAPGLPGGPSPEPRAPPGLGSSGHLVSLFPALSGPRPR